MEVRPRRAASASAKTARACVTLEPSIGSPARGGQVEGEEVCDERDNDCDGDTDEGLLNSCGVCRTRPRRVCDRMDNDCDGDTDEGPSTHVGSVELTQKRSAMGWIMTVMETPTRSPNSWECGMEGL